MGTYVITQNALKVKKKKKTTIATWNASLSRYVALRLSIL